MKHPFEGLQPEPWEILDRKIVGNYDDGILAWFLVLLPEHPRGMWGPVILDVDGTTIRKWPMWAPLPGSQFTFLTSPVLETLYCGPRGTGKSAILLMDFAREVGRGFGSNWRGILFRKQLGDLDEMVRKTKELYEPIFPGFRFKLSKADYAAVWPTGEELLFRHMLDESEFEEYQGHQYPWIGWEELTQWQNLKAYMLMFSCCRPTASGVPLRVRANTNPSGVGHNLVKKRFRLPGMFGRVIREPGKDPRVAIQSSLKENFVLLHDSPEYEDRVKASAVSAAQADAWATGNWNVTEGGIIDDVWRANVHVITNLSPRQLPPGWKLSRSYDHGQARPFAVLWWAESNGEPVRLPDGRWIGQIPGDLVLLMEWYGTNGEEDQGVRMSCSNIAQGIKDRERDNDMRGYASRESGNFSGHLVLGGPADTELWSKSNTGSGRAPIDDFQDQGIFFDQADKSHGSRVRGLTLLRERVMGAVPNIDGTREKPGLFVCMRCKYWLDLVPVMPRDLTNPDDIPKTYEDHLVDATRYRLTWEFAGMRRRSF